MATYKDQAVAALRTLDGFCDMHPRSLREGIELAEEPIAKHYEEKARSEASAKLDEARRAYKAWHDDEPFEPLNGCGDEEFACDADFLDYIGEALASQEVDHA